MVARDRDPRDRVARDRVSRDRNQKCVSSKNGLALRKIKLCNRRYIDSVSLAPLDKLNTSARPLLSCFLTVSEMLHVCGMVKVPLWFSLMCSPFYVIYYMSTF